MHSDSTPKLGAVYFARSTETDLVKIGWTTDLDTRAAALQGHSPDEIQMVAAVASDRSLERALHAAFAGYRVRGEWFQPCAELIALIAELPHPKRAVRRQPAPPAERIWRVLSVPKTVNELAAELDSTPNAVRARMNKLPQRFERAGTTAVAMGRPRQLWARRGFHAAGAMQQ